MLRSLVCAAGLALIAVAPSSASSLSLGVAPTTTIPGAPVFAWLSLRNDSNQTVRYYWGDLWPKALKVTGPDGAAVRYQGFSVPDSPNPYFSLAAGETRIYMTNLLNSFDLSRPGLYKVRYVVNDQSSAEVVVQISASTGCPAEKFAQGRSGENVLYDNPDLIISKFPGTEEAVVAEANKIIRASASMNANLAGAAELRGLLTTFETAHPSSPLIPALYCKVAGLSSGAALDQLTTEAMHKFPGHVAVEYIRQLKRDGGRRLVP